MSMNKDNKLVGYEYIEKYYDFDETGGDFEIICEGAPEEAENNNRLYKYLTERAECDRNNKSIVISDLYDITKLESKRNIPTSEIKESLDDDYILNIEKLKSTLSMKGYSCEEE